MNRAVTGGPESDAPPHLRLLGTFTLRLGDRAVPAAPAEQRLLAYLAVQHDPVPRAAAGHALWPDAEDARAAARLRSALWRLPHPSDRPLVEHRSGTLRLAPRLRVDTREMEQSAARLAGSGEGELPGPHRFGQDLLPGWDDDWLLTAREWLRQVRLRALEQLCARHCRAGRTDAALEAGMTAVACEPLRESAHRMVAAAHLADGNSAEALRQYDLYRCLLRDELGLAPSTRFRQLMAPLLGRPLDTAG